MISKRALQTIIFTGLIVLLTGCNGFVTQYENGAHWGFLESPVQHKCITGKVDKGTISVGGITTYLADLVVSGEGASYSSCPADPHQTNILKD